jgi:hypothetical protein
MSADQLTLPLDRLWFVGTKDGVLTHGSGYRLPHRQSRATVWLVESSPGQWETVNSQAGVWKVAFASADEAARYLENWGKERRQQLAEVYRALDVLLVEAAPAGK